MADNFAQNKNRKALANTLEMPNPGMSKPKGSAGAYKTQKPTNKLAGLKDQLMVAKNKLDKMPYSK